MYAELKFNYGIARARWRRWGEHILRLNLQKNEKKEKKLPQFNACHPNRILTFKGSAIEEKKVENPLRSRRKKRRRKEKFKMKVRLVGISCAEDC